MLHVHRLVGPTAPAAQSALLPKELRVEEGAAAAMAAAAAMERTPVFVEAIAPDAAERELLTRVFGLHSRSIDDALEPQHPPVFREFDSHIMLIVHAPESSESRTTRKIALFLGQRFLVTVLRSPLALLDPVLARLRAHPEFFLTAPERIAHAILDHMADVFEERVDEMIDRAESLSERSLEHPDREALPKLHQLRRRAASFTRVVRAQRDVCQALARGGCPFVSRAAEPYLRDVADHMLRIYDLLESVRDGILAARDSYLTSVNHELNVTMRALTAVATILLPLGLIAGIFGMNFENIPLAKSPAGFWSVLGFMALGAVVAWAWFRRRKWL